MGAVAMLFEFGIGFIGGGLLWAFYNDIITRYFAQYILNTTDPYYLASNMFWNAIPYALIIIGVICLIVGGLTGRQTRTVVYE